MQSEKISLEHQSLLAERLKKAGTALSEYSFVNLYLFREVHDHRVLREGEAVFVSGRTYDGARYLMPAQAVDRGNVGELLAAAKGHDLIFPVPEEWLPAFEGHGVTSGFSEGDSDYVYTVEKLSTYRGQKLHGQKNLLNQFLARFTPEAKPLTKDRMTDALDILETWQLDVGQPREATDYGACREAFGLYDELVLCGGIYYVDGEPGGFVIGEEIHPGMFALHFAKGKRKFKGLYQYMFNHFAKILPRQYAYLNFEQDLGVLALRIAKTSYHPDRILKKYRLSTNRDGSLQENRPSLRSF